MTIPLIVCILGLILYFLADRLESSYSGQLSEVGRIMFAFGLLVTLLGLTTTRVF